MGYRKYAIRGLSWMGAFRVITRVFAYIRIAILARLLTPEQFGLFGIASLVLSLLETLTQTGINIVLIQEKDQIEKYVDTAWIVSIIRGLIISLILIILAPFISRFFNSEGSYYLLLMIAIVAFIRGFINPARVTFLKNLQFRNEVLFSGAVFFLDSIVAVSVALIFRTPVGLVWGMVAGALLEMGMSHILLKPRPKFTFNFTKFKYIVGRGKWVTGSAIFSYFFTEGDDMVVGKLLNATDLGVYQMAYKIATLPLTEVTHIVNQVTFPIYSKFANDKKRLRRAYFMMTIGISAIAVPVGVLLFVFPHYLVFFILGNQWTAAVPVIRILAAFGVIRALSVSSNSLFNATKNQNYTTYYTLVSLIMMGVLVVPLTIKSGIYGAAMAALIGSIVAIPIVLVDLKKILFDGGEV